MLFTRIIQRKLTLRLLFAGTIKCGIIFSFFFGINFYIIFGEKNIILLLIYLLIIFASGCIWKLSSFFIHFYFLNIYKIINIFLLQRRNDTSVNWVWVTNNIIWNYHIYIYIYIGHSIIYMHGWKKVLFYTSN